MGPEEIYLHGADPDEQDRLSLMNRILNRACLAELGLSGTERVIEFGAGTGVFSADCAEALDAGGTLLAIERDPRQFEVLHRRAVPGLETRSGDVYDPPLSPKEWGSFDLVHARFLLEHLRDPERAVAVMARCLVPGGRMVLIDDAHSLMRFDPDPGGMRELWADYAAAYRTLGCDPEVGTRLVSLQVAAGLAPERSTLIPYGGCQGEPGFAAVVENLARVVRTAKEALLASGWTESRIDEMLRAFAEWSSLPDAAVWYGLPCAVAVRKI